MTHAPLEQVFRHSAEVGMEGIEVDIDGGRCERELEIRPSKKKDWLEEGLGDVDQKEESSALLHKNYK